MAVCKSCKEVIKSLVSNATATTGCQMDEDGLIDFDTDDMNDIAQTDEWRCPECEEIVALDEDEAKKFLKDKDELQEIVAEKINRNKEDGSLS